ncbi:hypothetical protein VXS03_03730 [Photobacterium sp. S4TG1]|uniref:hypothetical protein n=1 Tax=Photobacterium sp. S4TG1 TaxID=3114587 RepID=UPI002E190E90|nr:hypothetical protein [Photobacterium sp. S4TG1]
MRQLSDYQQQIQSIICNNENSLAQAISQLRALLEDIEDNDAITDTAMHSE